MWVKIPAIETIELIAHAGYDFVVIDLEHGPMSLESCYRAIVVGQGRGLTALVRMPDASGSLTQRVLDMGADGLLVPHVTSRDAAAAAVAGMLFPPHGARGLGTTSRAGVWGMEPTKAYLDRAVDRVMRIPQLEDPEAIEAAEEICAVDGVNAVLIGLGDLSLSLGVAPGDATLDPLIDRVLAAAHGHDLPVGTAVRTSDAAAAAARRGYDFVVLGNDATVFGDAATQLVASTHSALGAD
jgi:2-dehydro-3-deoxyglucarate aldolase/4-hydroxy-2-oxoheptanedioate aldolase